MNNMKQQFLILFLLLIGSALQGAQAASLNEELEAIDQRFFKAVFDSPNKARVEAMLSKDFTFTSGGKTKDRAHFLANLNGMWQQFETGMRMRRDLVAKSTQSHMEGDIAIQSGKQKLYAIADGNTQLVEFSEFQRRLTRQKGHWVLLSEVTRPAKEMNQDSAKLEQKMKKELKEMDSRLFDAVFAGNNTAKLRDILTNDFEFYHDKNGLVSQSAEAFVSAIERNHQPDMQREVIAESVKTYSLNGFGAIQEGIHRFFKINKDHSKQLISTARFFHVWEKHDGSWKLKREFSYAHQDT